MSDLLSASSLLLAISAILFSLWYPEIIRALTHKETKSEFKLNNVSARGDVTGVIVSKALPIAIVSLSVTLIFLPDAAKIFMASLATYRKPATPLITQYDAVATAYCFMTILSAFLTAYMWTLLIKLLYLRAELAR